MWWSTRGSVLKTPNSFQRPVFDPMSNSPETVTPQSGSTLLFLAGSVIAAGVLGIAAAHAPAWTRLLVLFSLGFGLLLGWLLANLASLLNVRIDSPKLAVIALAALGGFVVTLYQTVALLPAPKPSTAIHPITALVEAQQQTPVKPQLESEPQVMLEPIDPTRVPPPPAAMANFQMQRQGSKPQFSSRLQFYLHYRIASGSWPRPWPEMFFGGEVLLGMAGAVWMAIQCRRRTAS